MPNYNSIHTGNAIDTAVTGVASKAPLVHTHLIADVTDAATVASTGSYTDLTDKPTLGSASALDVPTTGDALSTEVVKGNDSRLTNARTPLAHTHAILDVSGLQTALDGKASSVHTHVIGDVTGLQTALDGKSDTTHTHTGVYEPANANIQSHISATNNPHGTTALQVGAYTTAQVDTLLSGKSDTTHNHTIDSLSNVVITTNSDNEVLAWDSTTSKWINQTASEAGLATATHTHTISDVTNLQTTLDGKQATLVSGTNIKTINSQSILGSGDLAIAVGASALDDLTDVVITTATTDDVLLFNGTNWVNSPVLGDIESALIAINGV